MFCSPDIQVGVPFSALVEKAMETQGRELLPKILEVVNALQAAKPNHTQVYQCTAAVDGQKISEGDAHKTGLEFDMSLPIDLPGLMPTAKKDHLSSKKEPAVGESVGKSAKCKPKFTEFFPKGGSVKPKGNGKPNTEGKDTKKDKDTSQRSPLVSDGKKYFKSKPLRPVKSIKEEDKNVVRAKQNEAMSPVESMEMQSNSKDTIKASNSELSSDKHFIDAAPELVERVSKPSNYERKPTAVGKLEDKSTAIEELQAEERDIVGDSREEKKHEISSGDNNIQKIEAETNSLLDSNAEDRKKDNLPSRRRSARIASLSDDQKVETESNQADCEVNENEKRNVKGASDEILHKNNKTKAKNYRNGKEESKRRRGKAYLHSSSDESDAERSLSSDKITAEEVTEKYSSKWSGYRKRVRKFDQDDRSDTHSKRHKTISRTASPGSTGSSASSSIMLQEGPSSGRHHKSKARSARRGTSRSPTPAVVTRYNRHVKPNRRYYGSDEDEFVDEDGTSGTDEQPSKMRKYSRWEK